MLVKKKIKKNFAGLNNSMENRRLLILVCRRNHLDLDIQVVIYARNGNGIPGGRIDGEKLTIHPIHLLLLRKVNRSAILKKFNAPLTCISTPAGIVSSSMLKRGL